MNNIQGFPAGGNMKRIPSELVFEAAAGEGLFGDYPPNPNPNPVDHDFHSFAFKNEETMNGLSAYEGLVGSSPWHQNLPHQQPSVSGTIDSQSSMCAGSPTSILKPKVGDNQGSGSSEDEDAEIDAETNDQSNDPNEARRKRRMASNRESARRSRKRRQAQLQDLELQVEQLSGENVTLYQQLTDADQKLRDATTNNRVLKSDVEALRAKVKLAEEMVTRGSLSSSLHQLFQTQLGAVNATLSRATNMYGLQEQDAAFGAGFLGINNNNVDHVLNANAGTGLGNEDVSCVTDIWSGPRVDQ